VLPVHRPITGDIECTITRPMFTELMPPEIAVGLGLRDPVFVHVCEQVELAEGREEGGDAGAVVGFYGRAGGGAGCGVGGGEGVVLSAFGC
jgi:hypothetical protein